MGSPDFFSMFATQCFTIGVGVGVGVDEWDDGNDGGDEVDLRVCGVLVLCVLCNWGTIGFSKTGMFGCEKVFAVSSPKRGFPSKHLQTGTPWVEDQVRATHFSKSTKDHPRLWVWTYFTWVFFK